MRKLTIILSIALIASGVASHLLWRELQAERTRNASLRARLEKVAARPTLGSRRPAIQSPVASPTPAPLSPAASPASSAAAAASVSPSEDPVDNQRRLMQESKYREAWRDQQRINYSRRRANLMRLLGFTGEEADAAIDLFIDRQMGWVDHVPVTPADVAADEAAYQARVRELLGEEKRLSLQEYMESRATRMQVDQYRGEMTGVDTLRDDQVEPLIAALHVEQAQLNRELQEFRDAEPADGDGLEFRRRYKEHRMERLKNANERMRTAAAPILSTTQLAKLDAMLQRELASQESQLRLERLQGKLSKPGARADAN